MMNKMLKFFSSPNINLAVHSSQRKTCRISSPVNSSPHVKLFRLLTPLPSLLYSSIIRWGKRSVSDAEAAMVRHLRDSPLRWGKRTMRSLDMAEMAAEMAAAEKRAPLRWGKREGLVR